MTIAEDLSVSAPSAGKDMVKALVLEFHEKRSNLKTPPLPNKDDEKAPDKPPLPDNDDEKAPDKPPLPDKDDDKPTPDLDNQTPPPPDKPIDDQTPPVDEDSEDEDIQLRPWQNSLDGVGEFDDSDNEPDARKEKPPTTRAGRKKR